jgi:CRP-like cAMP-binding protein
MGDPIEPGARTDELEARPRRRDGIELKVVHSKREGTRHVLEDGRRGRWVELRSGERDVFVWERLDGTRTLRDISLEFVDAHGALPRDVTGLVARLAAAGFIDGEAGRPPPPGPRGFLQLRLTVPGLNAPLGALATLLAPLARPAVLVFLFALGAAGVAVAPASLGGLRGTLLVLDGKTWLGVLALLGVSAAFSVLEGIARAAALRRGGRLRKAGLSLDAGTPGIFVDTGPAAVIPVEQRMVVELAPLAVALALGGGAALALFGLKTAGPGNAREIALLAKVARIGFLRALAHSCLVAPSGLSAAAEAWFHLDDMRGAATRFYTHDLARHLHGHEHPGLEHPHHELGGFSHREQVLLAYGGASLIWLVLAGRTLAHLALGEVAPALGSALHAGDPANVAVLLVPLLLFSVPLVVVTLTLGLALGRAAFRGAMSSPVLGTSRGAAGSIGLVALVLAWRAATLAPSSGAILAALAGVLAAALGFRATREDGSGRALLALVAAAIAVSLEAVGAALYADATAHGACPEGLLRALGWMHLGAALVFVAGASWEVRCASRLGILAAPIGWLALAGAAAALVGPPLLAHLHGQTLTLDDENGSAVFYGLGAFLCFAAAADGASGLRMPSRLGLGLAAVALALSRVLTSHALPIQLPATISSESLPAAFATLGLGLAAAAFAARSREASARHWGVTIPPEDVHDANAVFENVLATLPLSLAEHLGVGSARIVGSSLLAPTDPRAKPDEAVRILARRALAATRRVAGDRYLIRFLEAALTRVPARERVSVAWALSSLKPFADLAHRIDEGAAPDAEARARIFRSIPILGPLSGEDSAALSQLAVCVRVPFGTAVIREGEEGDRFYAIARGEAQVSVHGKDGFDRTVAHLREGDAFGEAALLRHERRAATVVAASPLELLVIERDVFLEFIQARKELLAKILDRLEDVWLVRSMAIFSELDGAQVAYVFKRFVEVRAEAGVALITQGEAGDRFYVIREGEVEVQVDDGGTPLTIAVLGRGDYFGEMALLHDAPRAASVVARTDVELLALDRTDFLRSIAGRGRARLEAASERRAHADPEPDGNAPEPAS